LSGQILGSLFTPESAVGLAGKGVTWGARFVSGALRQAPVSGLVDPFVQAQSISGGLQEKYDPWRTAAAVGVGSVIGGAGGALFGRRLAPGAPHATPASHAHEGRPLGVTGEEPGLGVPKPESRAASWDELSDSLLRGENVGQGEWAVSFSGDSVRHHLDKQDATLGRAGRMQYFMPLEDSFPIVDVASAYKHTGAAESIGMAYREGGQVQGVIFPLKDREVRLSTRADADGSPHYLRAIARRSPCPTTLAFW
jgi:hypothetical protein